MPAKKDKTIDMVKYRKEYYKKNKQKMSKSSVECEKKRRERDPEYVEYRKQYMRDYRKRKKLEKASYTSEINGSL